jgi:AcrR family transcriptional regulator
VSTRDIAEAAGIAEGTIFRVFATKEELIDAVFEDAFDPEAGRYELSTIDPALDLHGRLVCMVQIMQRRIRRIFALFTAVGFRDSGGPARMSERARRDRATGVAALAGALGPASDQLRLPASQAAELVNALVMALTHPMLFEHADYTPHQIADFILHGISRARTEPGCPPGYSSLPPEGPAC